MITTHPVLYKQSTKGATQIWYCESEGAKYRTIAGQQNGKHTISEFTTVTAKNIGKENETSVEQQCLLEVAALYKKKLAQGNYKENIEDIETANYFQPMLAKLYQDYEPSDEMFKGDLVFCQPKLDGVRCIASKDGLFTRQGKPIICVPHIFEALKPLWEKFHPDLILDGELYNHDLKNDFNKIISLVRKTKPTEADLKESANLIQYWLYDAYFPPEPKAGFFERSFSNSCLVTRFSISSSIVKIVPTYPVRSKEKLNELHAQCIEDGYEGSMVRIDGHPYENKRVNHLLKKKDFQDAEYPIIRIEEGQGNRSNMAGTIVYRAADGSEFGSGIAGGVELYRELWKDRAEYVGGVGTVKFFQLTPDGVPRFPVTTKLYKNKRDM